MAHFLQKHPRWGRGQETYGEAPYLTAAMGVSFVTGLQGDDPHYLKLVATPKHYAVHSGPESERHSFDARVDERDMRETCLPAFKACVKEAQAVSVMGAYNGRIYRYFRGEPLFPFCCGLSYTMFEFGNLEIGQLKVRAGGQVTVSVGVTNSGDRVGDEIVQLYVRHRDANVPWPIKELKGFLRIALEPGECKTVTFTLHGYQLGYYDEGVNTDAVCAPPGRG